MKKKEELNNIREKKRYVPYVGLFDLWDDEDEIPENLITLSCEEDRGSGDFMVCSSKGADVLMNINSKIL